MLVAATAEQEETLAAADQGGPVAALGGPAPVFAPRFAADLGRRMVAPRGTTLDGLRLIAARGASTLDAGVSGSAGGCRSVGYTEDSMTELS